MVPPPPPAPDMASYAETSDVYTLRDLVLRFAEENNVEFLPKAGRMHDGLQVHPILKCYGINILLMCV